jgi:hypothetical protein
MKHIITIILAALALVLCSHAQATVFDCMGRTLAGFDSTGKSRAFGTVVGDSANPQTFVHYDKTTGKSAGMAFYWYCRLPATDPACAPVPLAVSLMGSTTGSGGLTGPGLTGNGSCIRINNLHATMPQLAAFPAWIVAHLGAHGLVFFQQAQARQCWQMEAANSYPSADEKTLCEAMLAQARAGAPR